MLDLFFDGISTHITDGKQELSALKNIICSVDETSGGSSMIGCETSREMSTVTQ